MVSRQSGSPFLKDLVINILGTFCGALLALGSAFLFYHFEGKSRCNEQLMMMLSECEKNKKVCRLIMDDLTSIKKQESIIVGKASSLRLFSKATNAAAISEYLSRYVPPDLRSEIYIHSENLVLVNRKLDTFTNYLNTSIYDRKGSFSYIKQWVAILKKDIDKGYVDCEHLINRITSYLEKDAK